MNIGIYGGSFNPIHTGHIALARQLLAVAGLDEVWFMVSPQNPLKRQDGLLDEQLRLALARKALAGEPSLRACDYEYRLPRPSYTWNTLQSLERDFPQHTFFLLIGADNWQLFSRWYKADDLLARYPVVVYPREGIAVDAASLPAGVRLADTPLFPVSSTQVRSLAARGESVSGLVPACIEPEVVRYYGPDSE